jgi:hypothetical protein
VGVDHAGHRHPAGAVDDDHLGVFGDGCGVDCCDRVSIDEQMPREDIVSYSVENSDVLEQQSQSRISSLD